MKRRLWRRGGFLLLAFFYLLFVVTAYRIESYPMTTPVPEKTEYAVVLGAHSVGEEPTPVFRSRILKGIELYRQGRVKKIVFTGAPGNPPQAVVGKNVALGMGVPEGDILLETRSLTTRENLIYAKELIGSPAAGVFLVSDPLHLKRASVMAEDLGLKTFPAPVAPTLIRSPLQRFKFLAREIFAFYYYLLRR